jgi:GAF domain-containing protein
LIVQAIERRQIAAQNGRLAMRLSALGTLLSYAMHAPPDLAIAAALTQLPTILKPDWVGIYRLSQDKSWTLYWEPDHSSIHPEWVRANFEFLKQWMAEAVESLQPVVVGVPGGSESTVGSAHRSDGTLGSCVVVPLVGYVQTYGALAVANGSDSDHDIAPTEVQLIKVVGQAIALALDRSLGTYSPVDIGLRDKARTAANQLVREEVQV